MTDAKRSILARCAPLLAAAAALQSAHAQLIPGDPNSPAAKIRLLSDTATLAPGQSAWLAIEFDIAPKWHIYWPGQNDSGYAPSVDWTHPEEITIGPINWPGPRRYVMPGPILDHTYEGRVLLLTQLTASPDLKPGTDITLHARLEWLECEDGCVPRDGELSLRLPVVPDSPTPSADAPSIAAARAALPTDPGDALRVQWTSSTEVALTPTPPGHPSIARIAFYPHESGIEIINPLKHAEARAASLILPLAEPDADKPHLKGILECWDDTGKTVALWIVDIPRARN
ncbi:MAG: hypothetical protein KF838_11205 [Phycisphaeraceae bacterium]|nr:MAG: hypothetical protein KF838_11205 [Phycisphaeraceae bacterium]